MHGFYNIFLLLLFFMCFCYNLDSPFFISLTPLINAKQHIILLPCMCTTCSTKKKNIMTLWSRCKRGAKRPTKIALAKMYNYIEGLRSHHQEYLPINEWLKQGKRGSKLEKECWDRKRKKNEILSWEKWVSLIQEVRKEKGEEEEKEKEKNPKTKKTIKKKKKEVEMSFWARNWDDVS